MGENNWDRPTQSTSFGGDSFTNNWNEPNNTQGFGNSEGFGPSTSFGDFNGQKRSEQVVPEKNEAPRKAAPKTLEGKLSFGVFSVVEKL